MIQIKERKTAAAPALVAVSYPHDKEVVDGPAYTFRIDAGAAGHVEISIDKKDWQACRQAEGYWWYDWAGYVPGRHQAAARLKPHHGGEKHTSPTVHFQVKPA
jgi:hypothetical protein